MKTLLLASILLFFTVSSFTQKPSVYENDYIVKIGDKAPDFEVKYVDGTTKKLSDYKGKVIMLQFTASWCGVCRQEMPHIEDKVWNVFKDKNFVLLGVDRGEPVDKVKWFAEKMKITYPLIMDEQSEIYTKFALKESGVTRNVVIDQEGNIVFLTRLFKEYEFDNMIEKIAELLEE